MHCILYNIIQYYFQGIMLQTLTCTQLYWPAARCFCAFYSTITEHITFYNDIFQPKCRCMFKKPVLDCKIGVLYSENSCPTSPKWASTSGSQSSKRSNRWWEQQELVQPLDRVEYLTGVYKLNLELLPLLWKLLHTIWCKGVVAKQWRFAEGTWGERRSSCAMTRPGWCLQFNTTQVGRDQAKQEQCSQ